MSEPKRTWEVTPLPFAPRMSDYEALMWQLEKDPWFDPSGTSISICDGQVNYDDFIRRLRWAIVNVPRLRERVVPNMGNMSNPAWQVDPEFDLNYHIRRLSLSGDGSRRDLLDLVSQIHQDPFDRTRPLWKITIIEGLAGGQSAVVIKMHHTIADGIGALKISELYMQRSASEELPPEVDFSDYDPEPEPQASGGSAPGSVLRKMMGEVATWGADPLRVVDLGTELASGAQEAVSDAFGGSESSGSSPLFAPRSRGRRMDTASFDLVKAKKASKRLGGTVNDLFLTGVAQGAINYHTDLDAAIDTLSMTFVISTRGKGDRSSNAFVPVRLPVDAIQMSLPDRFNYISARASDQKEARTGGGSPNLIGAVATKLPTTVLTKFARQQTAGIDIATSNLRASPTEIWISGAKMTELVAMGPVAGTAANITAMSYAGTVYVGLVTDPAAVTEPERFQRCIQAAFDGLLRFKPPKD